MQIEDTGRNLRILIPLELAPTMTDTLARSKVSEAQPYSVSIAEFEVWQKIQTRVRVELCLVYVILTQITRGRYIMSAF
jgi:hypothetical protein